MIAWFHRDTFTCLFKAVISMNESQQHYAKLKKSNPNDKILYDSKVWNSRKGRIIMTESTSVVAYAYRSATDCKIHKGTLGIWRHSISWWWWWSHDRHHQMYTLKLHILLYLNNDKSNKFCQIFKRLLYS